jgi:hypothetical protein
MCNWLVSIIEISDAIGKLNWLVSEMKINGINIFYDQEKLN